MGLFQGRNVPWSLNFNFVPTKNKGQRKWYLQKRWLRTVTPR